MLLHILNQISRLAIQQRAERFKVGQSESYINKIENRRTLPSMTGFFYICEYLDITPQEFFNTDSSSPQKAKALLREIEKLSPEQTEHILVVVKDLSKR